MDFIKLAKSVTRHQETEEFLLVKRSEEDTHPGKWEFPGGGCEDEKPEKAALRELQEETGLNGELVKTGEVVDWIKDSIKLRFHPFLIEVGSKKVELSHEHQDHEWVELSEIKEFETIDGLKQDLKSLGVIE